MVVMPLIPFKPLADIPVGTIVEFENGGSTYAVCNVAGAIHCVDGVCPHAEVLSRRVLFTALPLFAHGTDGNSMFGLASAKLASSAN